MTYSFLLFIVAIISFPFVFPKALFPIHRYSSYLVASPKRFLFISRICLGFLAALFLVTFADPAHAQFYSKTQTWLETSFAASGGTNTAGIKAAIGLIFNVLRALFVIYLGIALVRVIVAARNDDDWQQLARIPLILVLAVTLGDLLAGLIVGSGAVVTTP
jgi:hypothetical protein